MLSCWAFLMVSSPQPVGILSMTQGCGQAVGWQWAPGSGSLLVSLTVPGGLVKMLRCFLGSASSLCAFSRVLFIQQRQGT